MKIEVLLQRNSNVIIHDHVKVFEDAGSFVVVNHHAGDVVAYYPVSSVSSITVLDC